LKAIKPFFLKRSILKGFLLLRSLFNGFNSPDPGRPASRPYPFLYPLKSKFLGWFLLAGVLSLGAILPHWDYHVDDAFITYRYATHLRETGELAYNLNEREEGYTSFLWVVLLALGSSVFPLPFCSKFLALLLMWGMFYWFYRLSADFQGSLGIFFLWLCFPLTWMNGMNGMETMAYSFLITAQVATALLFLESSSSSSSSSSGGYAWQWAFWALLSGLARPEGNLIAFFLALFLGIASPQRRKILLPLLFYIGLGASYFVARLFYFDYPWTEPWPNPFFFKVSTGMLWKAKGIRYVFSFIQEPLFPSLCLLAYFYTQKGRSVQRLLLVFLPVLAYLIFFCMVEPIVEYFYRFLFPIFPLILLVLLPTEREQWNKKSLVALSLCLMMNGILEYRKASIPGLSDYYSTPLKRTHVPLGQALGKFRDQGYVLAVSDAGIIPYYSGWKTIDIVGLNKRSYLIHGVNARLILQEQPTVLILHDHTPEPACNEGEGALLNFKAFYEQYELIGDFPHRKAQDSLRKKMDIRVYILKACVQKEEIKTSILQEIREAQQRYPLEK
jgi:arabinofuranosyltransferase